MATLTPLQIAALWVKAGGSLLSAPLAVAHALAESAGETGATSPNPDGGTNVGVFQLDTRGVGAGHTVAQLSNSGTNAALTVKATNNGQDWGQWSADPSPFLSQGHQAVSSLQSQAASHPGGLGGLVNHILGGLALVASGPIAAVTGIAGTVLTLPASVIKFFDQAESFVQGTMWLLSPANWVRIIAGIAGVVLLALGLGMFVKAAA